jgi:hypothetical protein
MRASPQPPVVLVVQPWATRLAELPAEWLGARREGGNLIRLFRGGGGGAEDAGGLKGLPGQRWLDQGVTTVTLSRPNFRTSGSRVTVSVTVSNPATGMFFWTVTPADEPAVSVPTA